VIVDAKHMCVASRGIKDTTSSTVTSSFHGKFLDVATRSELLKYIGG
jgi:GTP cyclohydrolase I